MSLSRSLIRLTTKSTSSCPACQLLPLLPVNRHHYYSSSSSSSSTTTRLSRTFSSYGTLPRRASTILDQTPTKNTTTPPLVAAVNPTASSTTSTNAAKPKRSIRARKAAVSLVSLRTLSKPREKTEFHRVGSFI